MKSLNAKRIAAIAASLAIGVAVAAQGVTFGSVPIINNQGQPVVQIVVGSGAKPSDGVVAANIAAAIGSLAHTTQNITATVSGRSQVNCVVTTPTCTLSNQQVWLGEKGLTVGKGSYSISALIGSVLNGGVLNSGNLPYTKAIPNYNTQTTYQEFVYPDNSGMPSTGYALTASPTYPSAWEGSSALLTMPIQVVSDNGGGMSFSRFNNQSYDAVVRLSNSQVPGLLSSSGTYQESEFLWVGGFPVYNQSSNAASFQLVDPVAAYQVQFNKPIQNKTNGASTNTQFSLLGQNWTVYNLQPPATSVYPTSSNFIVGGNVTLAQASTPLTTVYVGHNITSGPFTVVLNDLSYPTSGGLSNAALSVYKNGVLTNVTSAGPAGNTQVTINASGSKLFISVPQTFPGLYAYQKWAKIQLFSNTFNVTSGKDFNEGTNGHKWVALLRWTTNQSVGPATQNSFNANAALSGIVIYSNTTQGSGNPSVLTAGQSMSFISNPAVWKLNFVGDSLGSPGSGNTNFDTLSFSTNIGSNVKYQNPNGDGVISVASANVVTYGTTGAETPSASGNPKVLIGNVTEGTNYFTVSSSLPNAFQIVPSSPFPAPTSNLQQVTYNLNAYQYQAYATVNSLGITNLASQPNSGLVVQLLNNGVNSLLVSSNNQLTGLLVDGYRNGQYEQVPVTQAFNGFNQNQTASSLLNNVTGVQLPTAFPAPGVTVNVYETSNVVNSGNAANSANTVLLGSLTYAGPVLQYSVSSESTPATPSAVSSNVVYIGENNQNVNFRLNPVTASNTVARAEYFTYNVPEYTSATATSPSATTQIQITNSSSGADGAWGGYNLNTSYGSVSPNGGGTLTSAISYISSQGSQVKAGPGFRTERGSEVATVGTTSVTYDMARGVDSLQFVVGPATGSNTLSTSSLYGPYGVGQATNLQNVTIGRVNATCTFTTSSCNVTGLNSLTATPSVSTAVVGNPLNTAQNPIAVLDSQANNSSAMIVVGSKYVNSVAAQIFAQQPSLASFGPSTDSVIVQAFGNKILVAGYTANQTVQAGNQFIQDLLQNASS